MIHFPKDWPMPNGLVQLPVTADEVLYEAEAPIVFVTRLVSGQKLIALLLEEGNQVDTHLLAPVADETLRQLVAGNISVREAFTSSWLWITESDSNGGAVWSVQEDQVDHLLPERGTPLLPSHSGILRTRAVGPEIRRGSMPASVVAFVADSTRKAVKTILDHALKNQAAGRPTADFRDLYDLPVRRLRFASFEVEFGVPDSAQTDDIARRAIDQLEKGLLWACGSEASLNAVTDPDEREAILQAVLLLTPPSGGAIDVVEVSGGWIHSRGPLALDRNSRKKVRGKLRELDSEIVVVYEGRVGELDVDNLTLILRDIQSVSDEKKCSFDRDALDDLLEVFVSEDRVLVAGLERNGRVYVSAISRVSEDPSPQQAV